MNKFIYMAGLMDGEGTVGIATDRAGEHRFRVPYISVTTTTPEIAQWLKANFGGSISSQRVRQKNWKPSYSWRLRNLNQLFDLLEQIVPYMLEPSKIARAHLLLSEYRSVTPRNGKYSDEMRTRKTDFESRLLAL